MKIKDLINEIMNYFIKNTFDTIMYSFIFIITAILLWLKQYDFVLQELGLSIITVIFYQISKRKINKL
jgi:ABC-type bacteriocin/lantibiotic exporter with double-glycine peptidase domain